MPLVPCAAPVPLFPLGFAPYLGFRRQLWVRGLTYGSSYFRRVGSLAIWISLLCFVAAFAGVAVWVSLGLKETESRVARFVKNVSVVYPSPAKEFELSRVPLFQLPRVHRVFRCLNDVIAAPRPDNSKLLDVVKVFHPHVRFLFLKRVRFEAGFRPWQFNPTNVGYANIISRSIAAVLDTQSELERVISFANVSDFRNDVGSCSDYQRTIHYLQLSLGGLYLFPGVTALCLYCLQGESGKDSVRNSNKKVESRKDSHPEGRVGDDLILRKLIRFKRLLFGVSLLLLAFAFSFGGIVDLGQGILYRSAYRLGVSVLWLGLCVGLVWLSLTLLCRPDGKDSNKSVGERVFKHSQSQPRMSAQSKLEDGLNEAADIVTENLAKSLIDLRSLGLAPQRVTKLEFNAPAHNRGITVLAEELRPLAGLVAVFTLESCSLGCDQIVLGFELERGVH